MSVIEEVGAERRRQIASEAWSPEHDDFHDLGQLADAARCYIAGGAFPPPGWPWGASWWKPKDRRRDLIRAAALLVAEIERLDRAGGA